MSTTHQQAPPGAFSAAELGDRRTRLTSVAASAGVDAVVACGMNRTGSAVPWLTGWQVTREAVAVFCADGCVQLLVGFPNHVPDARRTVLAAGLGDRVEALVVQPNVCTPDLRAGVQTGEMVVVTADGCESLHRFPTGLLRLGGAGGDPR